MEYLEYVMELLRSIKFSTAIVLSFIGLVSLAQIGEIMRGNSSPKYFGLLVLVCVPGIIGMASLGARFGAS